LNSGKAKECLNQTFHANPELSLSVKYIYVP
jgi:hypothetical protein